MSDAPTFHLAPMTAADIPLVMAIDRLSFANPWSESSYQHELAQNPAAHLSVLFVEPRVVVGYAAFWLIVDEAHINNLAVHPEWRGQGLGKRLLAHVLQQALAVNAVLATLEVRAGNLIAQNLYRHYGFVQVGRRKRYYRDNGEDALLWTVRFNADYQRTYHL